MNPFIWFMNAIFIVGTIILSTIFISFLFGILSYCTVSPSISVIGLGILGKLKVSKILKYIEYRKYYGISSALPLLAVLIILQGYAGLIEDMSLFEILEKNHVFWNIPVIFIVIFLPLDCIALWNMRKILYRTLENNNLRVEEDESGRKVFYILPEDYKKLVAFRSREFSPAPRTSENKIFLV